jgi:cytochrome c peroxidase
VRLSRDNTVSCASCHHSTAALTDNNQFSVGIDGQLTTRNSMPLFNLAYHESFFRDGGVPTLEMQVLAPIENPIEMDMNIAEVCFKLDSIQTYHDQAMKEFGMDVNTFVLSRSLAAYLRTFISGNSRYDQFINGDNQALTAQEKQGLEIFEGKADCIMCHSGFNFTDNSFENIGLYEEYTDNGRGVITQKLADNGKYLVPSLRNIELTAPYMHDGSLADLDAVVDHYASGGKEHPNKSHLVTPFDLDETEKSALIAFLNALTDADFAKEQER